MRASRKDEKEILKLREHVLFVNLQDNDYIDFIHETGLCLDQRVN